MRVTFAFAFRDGLRWRGYKRAPFCSYLATVHMATSAHTTTLLVSLNGALRKVGPSYGCEKHGHK